MTVATGLRVVDYGDHALLLEFDSAAEVLAWTDALRAADLVGVADVVSAPRTVLVKVEGRQHLAATRQHIETMWVEPADAGQAPASADVVIDVVYDGADLAEVATMTGLGVDGVIAAHTATPWRVAFGGFAPGFFYLASGDPRFDVPRRAEPHRKVPAGAVALAGEFSGVYPRESAGGWQLLGHTDAVMWDINRPQPALLSPGMRVQFREAS